MNTALVNARVLLDDGFADGKAVLIADGHIQAVVEDGAIPAGYARRDLAGGSLMPGFIDVQVNGGGGALFTDGPSPKTIATIGAAHRRFGTTGFLPTLISGDLDTVSVAISATREALADGSPGLLGVHIEGPVPQRRAQGHP